MVSDYNATEASFPTWDRTGRRLAFESAADEHGNHDPGLYVAEVGTGHGTRIVSHDTLGWYGAWWLSWAPNDDRLLMWLNGRISVLDVNTGVWQHITDGARDVTLPSWSPSGDSVLFFRGYLSQSEKLTAGGLYIRDLRSGLQYRFLGRDSAVTLPTDRCLYSPDGRWIAYTTEGPAPNGVPNAAHEIEIVRSDGGERRRLTRMQGEARNPQWVSNEEIEFDYVSYECAGSSSNPVLHTMSVRTDGVLLGRWRYDLVDSRTQFSWPPAIHPRLDRAAVVWRDPETGYGELFVRRLRGGPMQRVFHYDRPSYPPRATPGWYAPGRRR